MGLGLVSGLVAISIKHEQDERAIQFTLQKLRKIGSAISSSVFATTGQSPRHYEDDVGALPSSLTDLTTPAGSCALDSSTGKLAGWCGPYWSYSFSGEILDSDGWGRAFIFSTSPRRIYSKGVNGSDDSGGSDDIVQNY